MITIVNSAQKDFFLNWHRALAEIRLGYYVVGAIDTDMSQFLAGMGVPCFDFVNEEVQKMGAPRAAHAGHAPGSPRVSVSSLPDCWNRLSFSCTDTRLRLPGWAAACFDSPALRPAPAAGMEWGQEGWRRMSWERVFILSQIMDWGFNIIVSDVDVAWLRDPIPLMAEHPHAGMLWSHDGVWTHNEPGDAGLEVDGNVHYNLNTGVYILRNDPSTAKWIHAWKDGYNTSHVHDQITAYETIRQVGLHEASSFLPGMDAGAQVAPSPLQPSPPS